MKKKTFVYTDGGFNPSLNRISWAWIVTDGEEIIERGGGSDSAGGRGNYDVEKAEASALKEAIDYIKKYPDNYILYSDSKSLISKIKGDCSNATKDSTVMYVRRAIEEIKRSPLPISLEIIWKKRRSDKWLCEVDDRCKTL